MAETRQQDAIALLKQDHRTVEELFEKFEKASGDGRKQKLAEEICLDLSVHAQIEEEIFYPACEGKVDEDLLKESYVEHDGAKVLIAEIMSGGAERRILRRQGQGASGRDRAPRRRGRAADGGPVRAGAQGRARHGRARRAARCEKAGTDRAVQGQRSSEPEARRQWTKCRSNGPLRPVTETVPGASLAI